MPENISAKGTCTGSASKEETSCRAVVPGEVKPSRARTQAGSRYRTAVLSWQRVWCSNPRAVATRRPRTTSSVAGKSGWKARRSAAATSRESQPPLTPRCAGRSGQPASAWLNETSTRAASP